MQILSTLSKLVTIRNVGLIAWNCMSALSIICFVSTFLRKYIGLHVIGLTGGISTGKSTCCKFFHDSTSWYVIDFDEIAHDVYAVGRPSWSRIRKSFGDDVLNKDHTINRHKLGEIVWKDRNKLKELMSITRFPILKDFLLELFLNIFYCRTQILDIPLLIEQKYILYLLCDSIILIYCNKQQQLKRLMDRDNIDNKQATLKLDKQMDINHKKAYVSSSTNNTVIDNSNDLHDTQHQLQRFMQRYSANIDTITNGTCSWKQALKPTKLSFILSTLLCIAGYTMHKVVTFI